MRPNKLRQLITDRVPVLCGWLSVPSSYLAEGAGLSGYDCVAVDLQHGMIGFETAVAMLQAISATPAVPIVRAPALDAHTIMHLLDAGAYGVIAPMVSTVDDVRELLSACRYPPVGKRSFGPARGKLYGGADYFDHADEAVMAIPMIETAEALDNIEEIVAVPGLDMIYIGPNDLALELGERPGAETEDSKTAQAIAHILAQATKANVPTGIFCASPELARQRLAEGFRMVTPGNDFALATNAMASAVKHTLGR